MLPEAKRIREEMATLKASMRAEMEKEFIKRSAEHRMRLEDLAWQLHRSGMSVRKAGLEVGTSNWRTAKDFIVAAEKRHALSAKPDGWFQIEDLGNGLFAIEASGWGEEEFTGRIAVEVIRDPVLAVVPHSGDGYQDNTPLHWTLSDWRNRDDSPLVIEFMQKAGLTK